MRFSIFSRDALYTSIEVVDLDTLLGSRHIGGGGEDHFTREGRAEEPTSELQSPTHIVCRLLYEKKKSVDRARFAGYRLIYEIYNLTNAIAIASGGSACPVEG